MSGGKREGAGRPKGSRNSRPPTSLAGQVALCVADGMAPEVIAAALGLDEADMRARFARELEHGAAIVRAQQLAALAAAAQSGNASAAKALFALASKSADQTATTTPARGGDNVARALRLLKGGRDD